MQMTNFGKKRNVVHISMRTVMAHVWDRKTTKSNVTVEKPFKKEKRNKALLF